MRHANIGKRHNIFQMTNACYKKFVGKDPFKLRDRTIDLYLKEYQSFIDVVSESTLQTTFESLLLVKFGIMSKRYIHIIGGY